MAPRRPWGSKGLACLCLLLSSIPLWCLLLLPDGAQKLLGASSPIFAAWQEPPQRTHSGAGNAAGQGVDFGPLFSEAGWEPHCEPGQVLLILVTSAPGNAESRQVIRRTWAAQEKPQPYPWQVVFLVGRGAGEEASRQIQQEQEDFGDVLVGNYLDTYRNLTLKVLHGVRWALGRCRPSYLLKTDDDCFVNTEWLPEFLARQNTLRSGLYAGSVFAREKRKVIRHPSSKWYVPREAYSPEEYPPYASGIGYVLSLDAAARVLRAAESVPPIPVEDAYVGILAQRAGLRPKSSARFAKQNARWRVCNFRYLMVVHSLSAPEQELATRRMREARHSCRDRPEVTRW
uniref:Hexosyltransferase n=1 Tax=Podarcis muralis TaxID=64176 RepID=A0A670IWI0_PODMU|nr:beta-1,3-galactosyltransferase 5-like [Podarcis muralis]XP_028604513.1 beta-1,3-galactosyltransferase 5-like [Podarcis muralis]XP_028604514.1 beta-1,3-galactosyltransferase 5-like [Podarcis muralis]